MEKKEPFCTVGGNVNGFSYYGAQYGEFLKKKKNGIKLPIRFFYMISPKSKLIGHFLLINYILSTGTTGNTNHGQYISQKRKRKLSSSVVFNFLQPHGL